MKRTLIAIPLALLLAACLGSDFADSVEGSWRLTEGTVGGETVPIIASHPTTITLDGDGVSGTASCNGYSGAFELDGSSISFGDLAITEMACSPEETMEAERIYMAGLTAVDTVSLDEELTLSGPDVELVFTAMDASASS